MVFTSLDRESYDPIDGIKLVKETIVQDTNTSVVSYLV
jgi:hypothetical protein